RSGTRHLGRTNGVFLGGAKARGKACYRGAEDPGGAIAYDGEVGDLELRNGRFSSATARYRGERVEVKARTFVAASGGFEANIPWLRESWGEVADNFIVRGTPYNQGRVLRVLLEQGMAQVGDARQCHA